MKLTRGPQLLTAHARSYCKGSVHNVMTPLTWMTVILEPLLGALTGISTYLGAPSWIPFFLAVLMVIILFFYSGVYLYFMLTNPRLLQTEDYNLELQAMNYLYGKENPDTEAGVTISSNSLPTIQIPSDKF